MYIWKFKRVVEDCYQQVDFNVAFQAPHTIWRNLTTVRHIRARLIIEQSKRSTARTTVWNCSTKSCYTSTNRTKRPPLINNITTADLIMKSKHWSSRLTLRSRANSGLLLLYDAKAATHYLIWIFIYIHVVNFIISEFYFYLQFLAFRVKCHISYNFCKFYFDNQVH